jgi:hypothetical protein
LIAGKESPAIFHFELVLKVQPIGIAMDALGCDRFKSLIDPRAAEVST